MDNNIIGLTGGNHEKSERFHFDGITLDNLAIIAGQTPAYIYSRTLIDQKLKYTRDLLPDDIDLHYSIKANPHPQTVSVLAAQLDGLDVASHAEMVLALGTGTPPEKISFSGPGKNTKELRAAVAAGIVLHVESENELNRIIDISQELDHEAQVALRINPDFIARRSGMVMGGGSQPFGIDLEQIDQVLDLQKKSKLRLQGLHCYAGSQMLNANLVAELQTKTLDMMIGLVERHDLQDVALNIGGGFGIPYFAQEQPLDLATIGTQLEKRLKLIRVNSRIKKVIIELGRYLIAESGIYIARVIEKKFSREKTFLILEGGMNHHLAASGNLGQIIRRNFPVACSPHREDSHLETVSLVGPLCTPLDVLGADLQLPALDRGDLVAILNSGAYGFSASPHHFLSHPPPVELLI